MRHTLSISILATLSLQSIHNIFQEPTLYLSKYRIHLQMFLQNNKQIKAKIQFPVKRNIIFDYQQLLSIKIEFLEIIKFQKLKELKLQTKRKKNTQKNLLVHLKLWIEKYIQEKNPNLRKQFKSIFANRGQRESKYVYMNLKLLQKVFQSQSLYFQLCQFFSRRILRYLSSSNIQDKVSMMKYMPILMKRYIQRKCRTMKQ